jgi:hypothetical protein
LIPPTPSTATPSSTSSTFSLRVLSHGKATLGVSAATALEVTSSKFKLVMVDLARALPALLFPLRKLCRGLMELIPSSSETMAGRRR